MGVGTSSHELRNLRVYEAQPDPAWTPPPQVRSGQMMVTDDVAQGRSQERDFTMLTEPMARRFQTASSTQPLKPSPIPRRACARSDLRLPVMGVGCWAFGGGDYWGPQSQQDVDAVVRCAVAKSCNYFDTAETYN